MISHRGISVITPLPSGEGSGEGPLPHRGISVITPLPSGGRGRGRGRFFSFDSSSAQGGPTSFVIEPFSSVEIILCRQENILQSPYELWD